MCYLDGVDYFATRVTTKQYSSVDRDGWRRRNSNQLPKLVHCNSLDDFPSFSPNPPPGHQTGNSGTSSAELVNKHHLNSRNALFFLT